MLKSEPTVHPAESFNAKIDADSLHAASKGQQFIDIICQRSNVQRLEIAKTYKSLYGEDLMERLKRKTSGKLQKVLMALTTPLPEFYAAELHNAMGGIGMNASVLIETLTTLSNSGIHAVSKSYEKQQMRLYEVAINDKIGDEIHKRPYRVFGRTLEGDIVGDTSGDFRKLLVALAQGRREENAYVTAKAAKEDAQKLIEAGVEKWGTDESVFNSILASKSYEHLEQMFLEYHALAGHPIEVAIEKEFSGNIKKAHLAIIKCVRNKSEYFAELLHRSLKGLGTDDKTLIRIVVARSEIDLGNIRQAFKNLYPDTTLGSWIHDDTSGDYRQALLTITGYD